MGDLDRNEAKDLAQNAKVKWVTEGYENSKFFHEVVKRKKTTHYKSYYSQWFLD